MKHIFPPKDMMRMMWQLATGNRLHSLYAPPLCQIQDDRDVINIRTKTTFNILFLCSQSHRQEIVFIVVASVCVYVRARGERERIRAQLRLQMQTLLYTLEYCLFCWFSFTFFLSFHPICHFTRSLARTMAQILLIGLFITVLSSTPYTNSTRYDG